MRVIRQYDVPYFEAFERSLPSEHEILTVVSGGALPQMIVLEDPDTEPEPVQFLLAATNQELSEEAFKYVGSVTFEAPPDATGIYHLFEVLA